MDWCTILFFLGQSRLSYLNIQLHTQKQEKKYSKSALKTVSLGKKKITPLFNILQSCHLLSPWQKPNKGIKVTRINALSDKWFTYFILGISVYLPGNTIFFFKVQQLFKMLLVWTEKRDVTVFLQLDIKIPRWLHRWKSASGYNTGLGTLGFLAHARLLLLFSPSPLGLLPTSSTQHV